MIGLVAVGQTFVVIAGGIDLSVGAIVTVSAVGVPLVALEGDASGGLAVAIILVVATCIGFLNGLGVALLRVHPMIMTLAMATFLQGVLILIAGGSAVSAENPLLAWLGNARPLGIPASVIPLGRRLGGHAPRPSRHAVRRSGLCSRRQPPGLGTLRHRRYRDHHDSLCGQRPHGRARRRPRSSA